MFKMSNIFRKKKKEHRFVKKTPAFRKFLVRQISFSQKQWDADFKEYVKEKYRERETDISENSPKEQRKMTFLRYLKGLDLSTEELKEKKILDLGCGEGEFVKECLDRGISKQVYGLDIELNPDMIGSRYMSYFISGDFEKKLPLKELDLVISMAGVEASSDDTMQRNLVKTLRWMLEAIKLKGEIRIFPIRKAPPGSELLGIEYSRKEWLKSLEEFSLSGLIDFKLRPIDIVAAGKKPDVWLEEVLIIRKTKYK
jgi:SAM-dependent methyltransferase